jgi:hypothetical protein
VVPAVLVTPVVAVTPAVVATTVLAPSVAAAPPAVTTVVTAAVVARPRVGVLGAGDEHRLVRAGRGVFGRHGRQRRHTHGGNGQADSGGQATDRSKNGHEVPLR